MVKKIAVIGAGFSGLAVCWHLLRQSQCEITLFDKGGIGAGASGMAAGLLHPYVGAHAKLNWMGMEGMQSTQKLLDIASTQVGQPVFQEAGILRIALDDDQLQDYTRCASLYPDVEWCDVAQTQSLVPGLIAKPGILIKAGLGVDCPLYLKGLWQACASQGAKLEQIEISDLKTLTNFDLIIVTAGAGFKGFHEYASLPLKYIKGQLLEFAWPIHTPPLKLPVNSYIYLVKHLTKASCYAGATYEREFENEEPDQEKAVKEIAPHVQTLFPAFGPIEILGCQAGIRVSTPQHRPIYGKIDDKHWYLTGMGSKGLLYHALFAEKLVNELLEKSSQ